MLDLEPIKARADYADKVACSGAAEGVWTAALAFSQKDVRKLVTEVERLRSETMARALPAQAAAINIIPTPNPPTYGAGLAAGYAEGLNDRRRGR